MPYCTTCGTPVAEDAFYCTRCGTARGQSTQPKAAPSAGQKLARVVIGLLAFGVALLVLLWFVSPRPDRAASTDAITDLKVATIYIKQAEACQLTGDKNCVKICADKMYRLLYLASQHDGIDRQVAIDYWREVMTTGDLGYRPSVR